MGRADDKEGEALLSEADDEKDKDYSDKDTSDIDDVDAESKKKYKCTEPGCTARFLRPSRLTWHLRKHNDERPYKCSIEGCTRAYTNSSHLKRHENTHKPVTTTYTCKECLLEVGSLFSLKRHRRMIHDPKRLTCAECGAKFRKKHCYNEHLSMHAGISMYKCKICELDFPTLRLMKRHQLVHEKRKTYDCKSLGCNEVFDKWSKLVKHVETDHQFDHKCNRCDKRFKLKCHLKRHKIIHTTENIFLPCPYDNCPKFYVRQNNLDDHTETFHQGRRFHCDTCNAALTSKASLIRHIQRYHEIPMKTQSKKKKLSTRRPRKDAGMAKNSMAIKLTGLKVSRDLEKLVLARQPKIILKNISKSLVILKNDNEAKSFSSTSPKIEEKKIILTNGLLKEPTIGLNLVTQHFVSLESKNEIKSSASLVSSRAKDDETTSVERISHLNDQTDEEILCSADSLLKTGKLVVLKSDMEDFSDTSEKINEDISLLADQSLLNEMRL